jgi:hypothetical protein
MARKISITDLWAFLLLLHFVYSSSAATTFYVEFALKMETDRSFGVASIGKFDDEFCNVRR